MKFTARVGEQDVEVVIERREDRFRVEVDGEVHDVDARALQGDFHSLIVDGRSWEVSVEPDGERFLVRRGPSAVEVLLTDPGRQARRSEGGPSGPREIRASMPGRVVRVLVGEGDTVAAGQGVVVVEAMKMENELGSPGAGRVAAVRVTTGQAVEAGALLAIVE